MRILHVYKDYHPIMGGIEGNIEQIAERQAAQGHTVGVLVTNPGDRPSRETRNGVEIIRAGRLATVASTPLSVTYPFLLRQFKPDVAHLHFPYPLGDVSQLMMGGGWPYVFTYHSDIVKQKTILKAYGPILKRVLAGAARIMPTSSNYVQSSPWLKPLEHNCTPVPLGILPERFVNAQPLEKYQSNRPTLLFLGRHRHYKGVNVLIEAMQHIDARLLVGGDGPLRAEYEALAARLNVGDKVTFLGNVPHKELPGLFASADIFILPSISRAEAFGIVLMEAMASGLPCITSELSTGTSFIVQHEQTGLVVPPADVPALAAAANRLIADPALRKRFGDAGRQRILTKFTIGRMVEDIMIIYDDVVH